MSVAHVIVILMLVALAAPWLLRCWNLLVAIGRALVGLWLMACAIGRGLYAAGRILAALSVVLSDVSTHAYSWTLVHWASAKARMADIGMQAEAVAAARPTPTAAVHRERGL